MEFSVNVKRKVEFCDTKATTNKVGRHGETEIYRRRFHGDAVEIEKIGGDLNYSHNKYDGEHSCSLPRNASLVSCKEGITESCSRCNYGAIQMNHLKELDIFIVRNEEHSCSWCDCKFNTESELKRHVCERRTRSASVSQTIKGRSAQLGTSPFANDADKFMNNVNIHLGCIRNAYQKKKFRRKFVCDECDFESDHLWNYKRHIMKHGNELPFKCSSCKYATSIKANLNMHIVRNHTKDKLYKCNLCSYENAVSGRIKEHKYLKHNIRSENVMIRDKKFKCSQCFYQSDYPGNLKRHESTCRLKIFNS